MSFFLLAVLYTHNDTEQDNFVFYLSKNSFASFTLVARKVDPPIFHNSFKQLENHFIAYLDQDDS